MGVCRACCQFSLAVLVAALAVLAFFHVRCQQRKELELMEKTNPEYRPELTHCHNIQLGFNRGEDVESFFGESAAALHNRGKTLQVLSSSCCKRHLVQFLLSCFICLEAQR